MSSDLLSFPAEIRSTLVRTTNASQAYSRSRYDHAKRD